MASRRDQLQSYQFMVQRVVSALVLRETDPAQPPFRRLSGAVFASVMVAVIALTGVALYGVIFPGGKDSWRAGDAVIIEKETGTRYVYRQGKLHPVANYASARLILGGGADTQSVSRNSLVGVVRGPLLGIPDAPDALPDPDRLLGSPWTLCSQPVEDDAGVLVSSTVLVVGRRPGGGAALRDQAVLVKDAKAGTLFLVWRNHRYEIADEQTVVEALVLGQVPRIQVGEAWLNARPAGAALRPMAIDGRGAVSTAVAGARVGQVFVVQAQGGTRQFYVALRDQLAPITEVQADLLLTSGKTWARQLAPGVAAGAPKAEPPPTGEEQPPARRPDVVTTSGASTSVCAAFKGAAFAGATAAPEVLVGAAVSRTNGAIATNAQTEEGTALADRVLIEPGWGAVVEAIQSPGAQSGTLYLITDQGTRYPVASREVLATLGYGKATPMKLPASLVVRIPEGPELDPAAAAKPLARR
jgi:type VII secretion protein EccB